MQNDLTETFFENIRRRMLENKNVIIIWNSSKRTGMSYGALRLAGVPDREIPAQLKTPSVYNLEEIK